MGVGDKVASHVWTGQTIMQRAPKASGVFAIFCKKNWIYVGDAGNLRAKLIALFDGEIACVKQRAPIGFEFELVPASKRVARRKHLIRELAPICNRA
jgi:hypothetical protein